MKKILLILSLLNLTLYAINMKTPEPSVKPTKTYFTEKDDIDKSKKILKEYIGVNFGKVYSEDYSDYKVEDSYAVSIIYGKQITWNWAIEVPITYTKKDIINKYTNERSTSNKWTSQLLFCYYEKFYSNFGLGLKIGGDFTLDDYLSEGFDGIWSVELGYGEKEGLDYSVSLMSNFSSTDTKYILYLNFYFR